MIAVKPLVLTVGIVGLAAGAYYAGTRLPQETAVPQPVATVLTATPADITFSNPTEVLLGEKPVPPQALVGNVVAATDLKVPDLRK